MLANDIVTLLMRKSYYINFGGTQKYFLTVNGLQSTVNIPAPPELI
jgi:hypothetical protein